MADIWQILDFLKSTDLIILFSYFKFLSDLPNSSLQYTFVWRVSYFYKTCLDSQKAWTNHEKLKKIAQFSFPFLKIAEQRLFFFLKNCSIFQYISLWFMMTLVTKPNKCPPILSLPVIKLLICGISNLQIRPFTNGILE